MLRNSFKFLSLVLAASLTVAPISAIGWGNSNSSRLGLAGLAVATVGLVGVMVYNYFSGKNTSEESVITETELTPNKKPKIQGNWIRKNVDIHEKLIEQAKK